MIDNAAQVERLLTRLTAALPLPARVTPELATTLQAQSATSEIPLACTITWISDAGDEGGIVCRLDFDGETQEAAEIALITHLRFIPHPLPMARDIAAYQKHRVKRLRRQPR